MPTIFKIRVRSPSGFVNGRIFATGEIGPVGWMKPVGAEHQDQLSHFAVLFHLLKCSREQQNRATVIYVGTLSPSAKHPVWAAFVQ